MYGASVHPVFARAEAGPPPPSPRFSRRVPPRDYFSRASSALRFLVGLRGRVSVSKRLGVLGVGGTTPEGFLRVRRVLAFVEGHCVGDLGGGLVDERIVLADLREECRRWPGSEVELWPDEVMAFVEAVEAARWLVAPGVVYEVRGRKALDGPLLDLTSLMRARLARFDFGEGL